MLLQRVWGVCRLRNARRVGMLGGTLAACALALATLAPSAYAFACGIQNHQKTTQTTSNHQTNKTTQTSGNHQTNKTTQISSSRASESSTVRYVYVYKCSCGKDGHASSVSHPSDGHSSKPDKKSKTIHHGSSGKGDSSKPASNQPVFSQPNSSGSGSGTTPGLPFTGSDPE